MSEIDYHCTNAKPCTCCRIRPKELAELHQRIAELEQENGEMSRMLAEPSENQNLKARIAEIERPPMVKELPTKSGNYHYKRDGCDAEVIKAIAYGGGRGTRYQVHGNDIEFARSDFAPGYWSARPIEPDALPEGGEQ